MTASTDMEFIPGGRPLSLAERIRRIPVGAFIFLEGVRPSQVYAYLTKMRKLNPSLDYWSKKVEGGVHVGCARPE